MYRLSVGEFDSEHIFQKKNSGVFTGGTVSKNLYYRKGMVSKEGYFKNFLNLKKIILQLR
jgi:hypothetical protein